MHWILLALLGLVVWLLSAPVLHAQTLYEWRQPDGTTVYSQWPPRSGQDIAVRTLDERELSGAQRAAAVRVGAQSLPPAHAANRALASSDLRIDQDLAALQRAERALRTGQVPRAGERQHLVNGHSRLTQAYFTRVSALESGVAQARATLRAAYATRDALATAR